MLVVCTLFIVPLLWQQVLTLFNELPRMLVEWQSLLLLLPERYPQLVTEEQVLRGIDFMRGEIGRYGQLVLTSSLSSPPLLIGLMIYLVLVPILVFFFLKDREQISNWIKGYLPRERGLITQVSQEMNLQIANYIRGKAIEILICAVVSYAVFAALGLNYAALMAMLVGVSVVVPYIGATVVTIPIALIGIFQWGLGDQFFYLMVAYAIIQTLDGNVLVPLLFSEAVNLHPVAIICAVLLFGGLWGSGGVLRHPLGDPVQGRVVCSPRSRRPWWSSPANDGRAGSAPAFLFLRVVQCLGGPEHGLDMTGHLHAAPFLTQYAVAVDEKGAAVHAEILLAVEFLQLDHIEQLAELLVLVADQLEGKALLGAKVLVGFQAVARDAKDQGVGREKRLMVIAKTLTFGRTARCVVLRIEVQHDLLAGQRREVDRLAAGSLAWKGGIGWSIATAMLPP